MGSRYAQIHHVRGAVLVKQLGVGDADFCASFALYTQTADAGEVLTEIVQPCAVLYLMTGNGLHFAADNHGLNGGGNQASAGDGGSSMAV